MSVLALLMGCGVDGVELDIDGMTTEGPQPPVFASTKTAVGTPAWDVSEPIQFSAAIGAHAPPYADEETHLPARFKTGAVFVLADWEGRNEICVTMIVLPTAAQPMIPNSVLPLANGADLVRNHVVIESSSGGFYPASTTSAGYSHMPLFFCRTNRIPTREISLGTFSWTVALRDATGAGYDLSAGPLIVTQL